jgi:MFS family permease
VSNPDPGSARQRLRLIVATIATLALVVVVVGIGTVIDRHGRRDHELSAAAVPSTSATSLPGPTATGTPDRFTAVSAAAAVTDSYYAAVKKGDARTAYRLLCARQRISYAVYAARIALNTRTGTGITRFRRTGIGTVRGRLAAVPGEVDLANGLATPIVVLLVESSGRWRVCSSNLGGVLPAPGTTPSGPSQSTSPGAPI